ncbi:histone-lysine N-methyltransferase SETMAR [Trichonephila clavipes]|nr:histone-lysine N-methyltransferase SETMAR [Trichonephila clavipes]
MWSRSQTHSRCVMSSSLVLLNTHGREGPLHIKSVYAFLPLVWWEADEIVNGADTVTANYVQFWFRRFRSGIFDVKGAPRTGRPVVENVDKITEIIDADRHVSSRSITQELRIDHKIVLKHFCEVRFKNNLDVWVPHQLAPKIMTDRISISEVLAKRNEIDPFLKRMETGDEKWVTYGNIV